MLAGHSAPVHDVHEHHHAQTVSLIDERLELLRCATPAAGLCRNFDGLQQPEDDLSFAQVVHFVH